MYALQKPKKANPLIMILAVIGGIALLLFGLVILAGLGSVGAASATQSRHEVIYRIRFATGVSNPDMNPCGKFDVTYATPTGTAQKEIEACAGYTEVARFNGNSGDFVYLSIQNTWPQNSLARFSCLIDANGQKVAYVESVGTPNIASCSGSAP